MNRVRIFLFAIIPVLISGIYIPAAQSQESVTIYGSLGSSDEVNLRNELNKFGAENGITISYVTLNNYEVDLAAKVKAGNEPDIALWYNPTSHLDFVDRLTPVQDLVDVSEVRSTLITGAEFLPTYDDKSYALPITISAKNLIWYNPENFANSNLQVPKNDLELTNLISKIKNNKLGYPWCVGIESGGATGWIATDWIEENVLRYGGLSNYLEWTFGAIQFNSPLVKKAGDKFSEYVLTPGNVKGGRAGVATTSFANVSGLFATDASKCFMIKQGNFITSLFPDNVRAEINSGNLKHVGVFKSPTINGTPDVLVGGGTYAGAFNARPATRKVLSYLVSPSFGQKGFFTGSNAYFSPHKTFPTSLYTKVIDQKVAEIIKGAALFGFDASDLRATNVYATEWSELTSWVSGAKSMEEAFNQIDQKIALNSPIAPTNSTYSISKNHINLSVEVPGGLRGTSRKYVFVLTSPDLGIAFTQHIVGTISNNNINFEIPISEKSWGKEVNLYVTTVSNPNLSTPYIKRVILPESTSASTSPTPKPTPLKTSIARESASPKVSVKPKITTPQQPKSVKCFKAGITRKFKGSKCPPGYQKK